MSTATTSKPKYQLFDQLRNEEYGVLENDILARGIMIPIEVDQDGEILDGHHRVQIAERHGLEYEVVTRRFKSEEEKQTHVVMLNMARRHLEPYEWGLAFERLLKVKGVKRGRGENQGKLSETVSECSAELGVDDRTARNRMAAADDFRALPRAERTAVTNREKTLAVAVREQHGGALVTKYTGEVQWYTPEEYIERVRKVLGVIDLDPASCKTAQKVVKAGTFYTEADDGLSLEWSGRVFMNPPYARPACGLFVNRLCDEHEAATVTEAILLTDNRTDTQWWQRAAALASAICFTAGRIAFVNPAGATGSPINGQAFCYLGKRPAKFRAAFADVGICLPGGGA